MALFGELSGKAKTGSLAANTFLRYRAKQASVTTEMGLIKSDTAQKGGAGDGRGLQRKQEELAGQSS